MDPDSNSPARGRRSGEARPPRRVRPDLSVSVTDGAGRPVRDGGLARWLARIAPRRARGELAVALVSDARMRLLNRSYRRQDYATDVLSFETQPALGDRRSALGDIVIATGVARRQAREAGHSFETELRVLALHGLLHLLGYDHENATDNGRMARLESRLRARGGLRAGLVERTLARPPSEARRQARRASREARKRAGVGPREP